MYPHGQASAPVQIVLSEGAVQEEARSCRWADRGSGIEISFGAEQRTPKLQALNRAARIKLPLSAITPEN